MQFRCVAFRFTFEALDAVSFAPGAAANAFRGAFGHIFRRMACSPDCPGARICDRREECAYARLFEPACLDGPSGLADAPRPFILRAGAVDGESFEPEATFFIDIHVFDLRDPAPEHFARAFEKLAEQGIGGARGRVRLIEWQSTPVILPLDPDVSSRPESLTLRFLTPTELKCGGRILRDAPFAAVFARARDRVATLSALYGGGPLDIDFRGMSERAKRVITTASDLQRHSFTRTSSRTGQRHPLGGFTGEVRYCGEVGEFLPFLRAAYWTGIGRQTVWGKGAVEIAATSRAHVPTSTGR